MTDETVRDRVWLEVFDRILDGEDMATMDLAERTGASVATARRVLLVVEERRPEGVLARPSPKPSRRVLAGRRAVLFSRA